MDSVNPHPTLAAAAPGIPVVLDSSAGYGWKGLQMERHRCAPGPRAGHHVDRPVLILLCSASSRGEHKNMCGSFVPYRKQHGALTSLPQGPASEIRLLVESELAYAAFYTSYLASVAAELDLTLPETQFRSGVHDAPLSTLFHLLLGSLSSHDAVDRLYVDSLTHALAIRFLRWNGVAEKCPTTDHHIPTAFKLRSVQDFIAANLAQSLDLETLARQAGYTRSHFARWFRAGTGKTAHAFVTEQRLERARRMLASHVPLTDVAAACGFAHQSHMTQMFRRFYGDSPAAMRKHLVKGRCAFTGDTGDDS